MPPLSIMIKPASSLCNMRCEYCFYHDVASAREEENLGIMSKESVEHLIKKAFDFAAGESVSFAFQGGEPLLAGLDYFKNFTTVAKRLNTKNSTIHYGLQTNGSLVDESWAEFFKNENFLIGLSLDGDQKANKFRVDAEGKNKFHKTLSTARLLEDNKVEFNILCVLTGYSAMNIDRIYKFYKSKNFKYLQFIPCLRPFDDETESTHYMTVDQYKYFLIHAFNTYVKDYVTDNYTSIRQFDNWVQLYLGKPPEQCGMLGHCMHQFVVEGNGNVYPCDFYCLDEWLLGNINDSDFKTMANSEKATEFIRESLQVEEKCKTCKFYNICRGGGCKRSRADRDYCDAYDAFFAACLPLFRVFINER